MRLYFFNVMYMHGIHNGIQALHSAMEIEDQYPADTAAGQAFRDWRRNHKTVIVTNAGYEQNLHTIHALLHELAEAWEPTDNVNGLAIAKFHESKEALNGALTSVAVVVPPSCYAEAGDKAARLRQRALFQKANDLDLSRQDAAELNDGTFTVHERLELLCSAFPLAS